MTGGTGPGRTVVTGANSGVGKAAAGALLARDRDVVMVCRSRDRGEAAREELAGEHSGPRPALVQADLAHPESVRAAAREIRGSGDAVDTLVNNAGLYLHDRRLTDRGFEATMAVNHLGHFLLTALLLPTLREAEGRVVVVSSGAHRHGDLERAPIPSILRGEGAYRGMRAYADSKLANLLFALELARREEARDTGVSILALHPGMLATSIWNRNDDLLSRVFRLFKPLMGSPEVGGEAVARLAADPELEGVTGRYFEGEDPSRPSEAARDRSLARRLWTASMDALGLESFPPD